MIQFYKDLCTLLEWFFQKYKIVLVDGYANCEDILSLKLFNKYILEDLEYVSWCDDEQRFELKEDRKTKKYYIRLSNQKIDI